MWKYCIYLHCSVFVIGKNYFYLSIYSSHTSFKQQVCDLLPLHASPSPQASFDSFLWIEMCCNAPFQESQFCF